MTAQALPFVTVHKDKAARLTAKMLRVLADGCWHSAADLGMTVLGLDDRTARSIAERSEGSVISSQLGYKLTSRATDAEVRHAESTLRSQARKMLARANEIKHASLERTTP